MLEARGDHAARLVRQQRHGAQHFGKTRLPGALADGVQHGPQRGGGGGFGRPKQLQASSQLCLKSGISMRGGATHHAPGRIANQNKVNRAGMG